jgi:hypothetical protein
MKKLLFALLVFLTISATAQKKEDLKFKDSPPAPAVPAPTVPVETEKTFTLVFNGPGLELLFSSLDQSDASHKTIEALKTFMLDQIKKQTGKK